MYFFWVILYCFIFDLFGDLHIIHSPIDDLLGHCFDFRAWGVSSPGTSGIHTWHAALHRVSSHLACPYVNTPLPLAHDSWHVWRVLVHGSWFDEKHGGYTKEIGRETQ